MKRIDCGLSGGGIRVRMRSWSALGLAAPWPDVAHLLSGSTTARPVQRASLQGKKALSTRRNLIVSAPTNSGKTLVGMLILLDAIRQGGRAVLIEPLRALARERADDAERRAKDLERLLGRRVAVRVTTGDYRLDEEELTAPPPQDGQLVIATPERLDAILRNPANDAWTKSVKAVCVDEAHLIADRHRGPTLELVVTSFLVQPTPPRIVLLSATMGSVVEATRWLDPCDAIVDRVRYPALRKEVVLLEGGDQLPSVLEDVVRIGLQGEGASVLVFVYQTASAAKVARELTNALGPTAGSKGALAYHSQMSSAHRERVRQAFVTGESRVVVSTTALALGVNLPASHVIIRDSTFAGEGRLGIDQLLQMMGRAGRGEREGHATVIVKAADGWDAQELADKLRGEVLKELDSSLMTAAPSRESGVFDEPPAARVIASLLARRSDLGMSDEELEALLGRSLGARALVGSLREVVAWLTDPLKGLAFRNDMERLVLTRLGVAATRAVMPLSVAGSMAQLLWDLMTISGDDQLLSQWRPLDHLVLLELVADRPVNLRRLSEDLADQVDGWMERQPSEAPLLYRKWLRGVSGHSKADEVLGSLGIRVVKGRDAPRERAMKAGYLACSRAIILFERSQGVEAEELEHTWGVKSGLIEGVEERWRDTVLWLLSGWARVLDVGCFRYHLSVNCLAGHDRVKRVQELLKVMRKQVYDLMLKVQRCSSLGAMMGLLARYGAPRVGVATIRKLEGAGVRNLRSLAAADLAMLIEGGVSAGRAARLVDAARRQVSA